MNALCCSACGDVIIKSSQSGTKIRAKVLIMRDDGAYAVCKGCDKEIKVPLQVDQVMLKSMQNSTELKLFIKK